MANIFLFFKNTRTSIKRQQKDGHKIKNHIGKNRKLILELIEYKSKKTKKESNVYPRKENIKTFLKIENLFF